MLAAAIILFLFLWLSLAALALSACMLASKISQELEHRPGHASREPALRRAG
ncbi:MAG: hypothetical protein ABFE16_13065 [Armatimonadia bacterium]